MQHFPVASVFIYVARLCNRSTLFEVFLYLDCIAAFEADFWILSADFQLLLCIGNALCFTTLPGKSIIYEAI